jgi:hypothetical protein
MTSQPPPADDLEDLYEEVWASFAEDSPSPNTERENIYSTYGSFQSTQSPSITSVGARAYHAYHVTVASHVFRIPIISHSYRQYTIRIVSR